MEFFENLGKKISDTGKTAVQKTKEFGESARLHSEITSYQCKINELYTEIGREYVRRQAEDVAEPYAQWVRQVNETQQQIDWRTQRIEELKTKGGGEAPSQEFQNEGISFMCTGCGAVLTSDAKFCAACGQQIQK